MTPNEQKAKDVLKDVCNSQYDSSKHEWKCPRNHGAEAAALSAAGLLVTPDHEAALAACEAYARDTSSVDVRLIPAAASLGLDAMRHIGRRSLDAKKPKERWTFFDASALLPASDEFKYGVREILGLGAALAYFRRAEDARAYAADMNAKEAGR